MFNCFSPEGYRRPSPEEVTSTNLRDDPDGCSTTPRCALASGGLDSCVMECSCKTCLNSLELKSGPLSVRTNWTDRTCPVAPTVPCRTTLRRKLSKIAATWETDFKRRIHFLRVASSIISRKYQNPPNDMTGCLPLQSRNRRVRYSVARVVAASLCGSAFWFPAGQPLHFPINFTYLRSPRRCLDSDLARARSRTVSVG